MLLAATAALAGLARGFSGFGAALIFMPIASALVTPAVAAPLLLVVDAAAALGLVPGAFRRAERRDVAVMAAGAFVGVPLGTALLARLDPIALRWGLAVLVLAMLALLISGWRYRGRPAAPLTVAVGAVSGLMSGAAQVGGPPVVAFWLGGAADAATVRANIVLFFAVSTVIAIVAYTTGGLLTLPILVLALVLTPIYALTLFLGARMFSLASETTFRRICYGLIAAAGTLSLPLLDGVLR